MGLLARGGLAWVLPSLMVTIVAAWLLPWAAVPLALVTLFLVWFHRDPRRTTHGPWVAPADGRVLRIDALEDGGHRVVTFLSPFNMHVVRSPCAGRVTRIERVGRGHRPAFHPDADHNEGLVLHLDTPHGPVRLSMLVGLVARRARSWVDEGDVVGAGQRIGMIHLGSRVDVALPPGVEPMVVPRRAVRAGQTLAATVDARPRTA